ncbi:hypothetical protein [Blastococcus brunescens]|uniref:Uncharacterized protein n=1 Tax=Blastococcus brunescens TaxID=1564165 RepID=A0ABZ1B4I9_9ACTN|nr:hypothetical protein [Blastococcus sp. BMG 8361]WRL65297.1 hypothetical protein U6N30_06485 [Blastococcus sp. BMG 8361]
MVTGGRGFASNHYLRERFHRCIDLYSKMWHHHTELLMLGYGAYVVFFEFCKQAFPEMGDQMVARMVAGMDVTMYRPDDELKKLAALAVELDLADLFVEGAEPAKVLAELGERGDGGARWLAALEAAKDPWFNVSVGDGFYHHHLSWADDLTVPFAALPRYVEQIAAGEDLTRPTERLAQERDRIAGSTGPCWTPRRRRRPSTRCWACAGRCSPTSSRTSSTASTGSPRASSRRSGPSGRCWPSAACCWRPTTSSTCGTSRSRTPSSTSRSPGPRVGRSSVPGTGSRSSPSASGSSRRWRAGPRRRRWAPSPKRSTTRR